MAKKGKYDKQHQVNLTKYERQVDLLYQQAINEAVQLGVSLGDFDHSKPFSFGDYPLAEKKADKLVRWLQDGLTSTITKGISTEWALSNKKNDAMAKYMLGKDKDELPAITARKYYNHNGDAEKAFVERMVKGLGLSDRVWRYTDQFKNEIELGLDLGIRSGRSAADISRDIRLYLQQPDRLFRRVKTGMLDDEGKPIWRLSKAAQLYHPGQGVYRSSYKNARRLAATETNIAYRTADHTRWQQMDFVLGQHVLLSNNHTLNNHSFYDICDELSGKDEKDKKGRYPKDFKFTGWHPLCRCFVVPILVDEDEMEKYNNATAEGKEYKFKGQVEYMPKEFNDWVNDNVQRIARSKSLPYFIKDNMDVFANSLNADAQRGIDISIFKGKPSGITVDNTLLKNMLREYATKHEGMIPEGVRSVEIGTNPLMGYMACKKTTSGCRFIVTNYDFNIDGHVYNPAKSLNDALSKMAQRKKLSFDEEYAVEGLWHELNHAKAKGWRMREIGGYKHDDRQRDFMETLNQFVARRTYQPFMKELHGRPQHYGEIMEKGYGYSTSITNVRILTNKLGLSDDNLHAFAERMLANQNYEDIRRCAILFLRRRGIEKAEWLIDNLKRDPDKYVGNLIAMLKDG